MLRVFLRFVSRCHILLWKNITANWILCIRATDFERQTSAHKFQVFFTVDVNSQSLFKIRKNNTLNLINKSILDFIRNNVYWLRAPCFFSFFFWNTHHCTPGRMSKHITEMRYTHNILYIVLGKYLHSFCG